MDHLFKIEAHIKCKATGEVRIHLFEDGFDSDGLLDSLHLWTDGNYGCDCNRELFFLRAGNEEDTATDIRCGEERYAVNLIDPDGTVYHREF